MCDVEIHEVVLVWATPMDRLECWKRPRVNLRGTHAQRVKLLLRCTYEPSVINPLQKLCANTELWILDRG